MKKDKNLSEGDKKLLSDIEEYGLHVIYVLEDESGPGFGYSVGLFHTYNHPEILIIGLKQELIHSIINSIGDEVKKGNKFESKSFYSNLIEEFDCYFIDVKEEFYKEYVGYGLWYYEYNEFPLLQCIYPTIKGVYPWEKEWPDSIKDLQPILGDVEIEI
jgi:hypothetical protein